MNILLILALVAVPSTSLAGTGIGPGQVTRTPQQPSVAEQRRIMSLIGNATGYHLQYLDALEAERTKRGALFVGDSLDYADWEESASDVANYKGKLAAEFAKIVRATEGSYRVGPDHRKGKVTGGLLNQRDANWEPLLLVEDVAYEVARPGKKPVLMVARDNPTVLARTLNDGKVYVSIEVLLRAVENKSPAIVASTLEHEGVHFNDLVGPNGLISRSWDQYRAYDREVAVAFDIGLEEHERKEAERFKDRYYGTALAMGIAAPSGIPARPPANAKKEYPYIISPDENLDAWKGVKKRVDRIAAEQLKLRKNLAAIRRGETPEPLRDALNDRRPPDGATTHDGCNGIGFWAGDVYVPATPCARVLPPPTHREAIPAVLPPPAPVATLPLAPRPIPTLAGLAERICANPSAAHSLDLHAEYRAAWYDSKDDGSALPRCAGEVFRTLKKLRQEGFPDYDSAYFQSLTENLNMPQPPTFEPPEPRAPRGNPTPPARGGGQCYWSNDGREICP